MLLERLNIIITHLINQNLESTCSLSQELNPVTFSHLGLNIFTSHLKKNYMEKFKAFKIYEFFTTMFFSDFSKQKPNFFIPLTS